MQLLLIPQQRFKLVLGLEISGGATCSIFPEVEEVLLGSSKVREALTRVRGGSREAKEFRSFMDFFVCMLLPEITPFCFEYYAGEGRQLREQIDPEGRTEIAAILLAGLEAAVLYAAHEHFATWDDVRRLIQLTLEPAPIRYYPEGRPELERALPES